MFNMNCMSVEKSTESTGATARNKYVPPVDLWEPKYGILLPMRLMLKRFTTGELVEHVVFHSEKPPNHLLDLQDYTAASLATMAFISTEDETPSDQMNSSINAIPSSQAETSCGERPQDAYTRSFLSNPRNMLQPQDGPNPQSPAQVSNSSARNVSVKMEPSEDYDVTPCETLRLPVKEEPDHTPAINALGRGYITN